MKAKKPLKVFLLRHSPKSGNSEKIIGVFFTKKEALSVKSSMKIKPGFMSEPRRFYIDNYVVGNVYWKSGFFSFEAE